MSDHASTSARLGLHLLGMLNIARQLLDEGCEFIPEELHAMELARQAALQARPELERYYRRCGNSGDLATILRLYERIAARFDRQLN